MKKLLALLIFPILLMAQNPQATRFPRGLKTDSLFSLNGVVMLFRVEQGRDVLRLYDDSTVVLVGGSQAFKIGSTGLFGTPIASTAKFTISSSSPSEQLRLAYDESTYLAMSVANTGELIFRSSIPNGLITFDEFSLEHAVITAGDALWFQNEAGNVLSTITNNSTMARSYPLPDVSGMFIVSLNGLDAAGSQHLAVSTTGTDFTITSADSIHTFNMPSASATARGLVTTGSQTIAGDKTFSGTITSTGLTVDNQITTLAGGAINLTNDAGTFVGGLSANVSETRNWVLPDASGTIALSGVGDGVDTLNGLGAAIQTFAAGTSGTDFNISSVTATHTFNIPSASATARGLVTTGAQTFAGDKTFTGSISSTGATVDGTVAVLAGGDITIENDAGTFVGGLAANVSDTRNWTLPDATGTIALTSQVIPSGAIVMWSGSVASIPSGWALCDGTSGTPDLRNRMVVGAGSGYWVGRTGGDSTVTLSTAQLAAHSHSVNDSGHDHGITDPGHSHSYNVQNETDPGVFGGDDFLVAGVSAASTSSATTSISVNSNGTGVTIANAGSGQAHENRPMFYALAFIMKL